MEATIARALEKNPGAIFVISTCVVDTIGDDVAAVCAKEWDIPVIHLESAGFLGGSFNDGFINALKGVSRIIQPSVTRDAGINLVGEKNLEFEVEENFIEIKRLLEELELDINIRFVRNINTYDLDVFAHGTLNILREDPQSILAAHFYRLFGIPSVNGFPVGLNNTLRFLEDVGRTTGTEYKRAVRDEHTMQEELALEFSDLRGKAIAFDSFGFQCPEISMLKEVAELVGLRINPEGTVIPVPFGLPVGTNGIRHMLHQWRRFVHA